VTDEKTGEPIAERPDSADDDTGPDSTEPRTSDEIREPRPALERIGMAAVAVVMGLLFGVVAVAAFAGGEYFLAAMGFVGCMMTLAVGGITLLHG